MKGERRCDRRAVRREAAENIYHMEAQCRNSNEACSSM